MKTILTRSPETAAEFIKNGGLVAFPTETVYGLGADIFNEAAIGKIFEAKRRPADNPLIAHIGGLGQIRLLAAQITAAAHKFIEAFFPGPLTLVLPRASGVPLIATAGLDTIGVRMPDNELARQFLERCGTPLVAPSANLSGKPSPTTWRAVFDDLDGRIDCILQGSGPTAIGLESTVVDCTSVVPLILRAGAVTLEQLREIEPKTRKYRLEVNEQPKSPGLRHRHYSPRAKVVLILDLGLPILDSKPSAFIGLDRPASDFALVKICSSFEDYAHSVFEFFRECDRENIGTIYCQRVEEKGIGAALMDRLKRAGE